MRRVISGLDGCAGVLLLLAFASFPAFAERVVVDFPLPAVSAQGSGESGEILAGPVTEWEEASSRRIDIPLAENREDRRVVLTVVFEEAPGDAIRIWGEPNLPGNPVPIAGEWTDGIRGWNQKSVLVPSELLRDGGNLVIESAGSSRKIHRLVLASFERGQWFVPPGLAGMEYLRVEGEAVGADELRGRKWEMPPDAWNGNVIEAHLQEFTESMQGGVEFLVEIKPAPQQAVLRFEVSSAGMTPPSVWVNGAALPHVSVEIPPLRGPTIVRLNAASGPLFPGWRAAWVHIPAGLLVAGENRFTISSGPSEGFVRRARVEMWFAAPVLPPRAIGEDFPDVLSESLDQLPPADSAVPDLPAWEAGESGEAESTLEPDSTALETLPAAAEWFRTSLRQ